MLVAGSMSTEFSAIVVSTLKWAPPKFLVKRGILRRTVYAQSLPSGFLVIWLSGS